MSPPLSQKIRFGLFVRFGTVAGAYFLGDLPQPNQTGAGVQFFCSCHCVTPPAMPQ